MGGVMYARNLLKALNTLDDKDKPFIDVYCRKKESYEDLKAKTGYPYMNINIINDNTFYKRIIRKTIRLLKGFDASCNYNMFKILPADQIIFPYASGTETKKLLYWKPDFQEKYLPEYFPTSLLRLRDLSIRSISRRGIPIVFSSQDSENDFKKYYPEYDNKTFVVHFAVSHNDFTRININEVKKKYGINGDYLLCANQFWKHKNHLFLFRTFRKALQNGIKLQLVCTGNLSDYRNPEYIQEIGQFLSEWKLEKNIILPGLVNSDELYCLIKNSYAVIQPSLFEGWNTTVEDCKALNKFIFLSDLPVHHEQVQNNVCFFDPYDEEDLLNKLLTVLPTETPYDYSNNLYDFGRSFMEVVKYVSKRP